MDAATKTETQKVSSAYRQLAIKHNIAVSQKFLVAVCHWTQAGGRRFYWHR